MLDAETKRRIDTARDILVGKVPDPKSQVEQITIALIYKFMDDLDAESEEFGGARRFFAGEFSRYGWAKLMRSGLGGYEVLNLYAEAINKMPENPGIPPLFRDIFKNAFLPYRDPETLRAFLKIIDEFTYDHSERLGDAFEYLLSVLGSQGDAGQFRTPRHIIDFIVAVIDPKKDETVLDPACGTAGFLISSFKHILKSNTDEQGHSTLTPDEKGRLAANFKGYDISPDMVRLSLVNLYLHGFADPHISEYDTLTSEDRWNEYADVILANPPFMSPKGGIRPHNHFSVKSKRSEVLFVDYMAEHLTPSGRAGIIVPEGIIFQSQTAHKQLRKMLVENYLVAVISLPSGVFQPYSGVKTSILILDKVLARKADRIGFFKVENDGFDLGAQRRPIDKNDLPQVRSELAAYLHRLRVGAAADAKQPAPAMRVAETGVQYGTNEPKTRQGLIIGKEKIASDGEFNLSGGRYRETVARVHTQWTMVAVRDMCSDILSGGTPSTKKEDYWNGDIPWITSADIVDLKTAKPRKYITEAAIRESATNLIKKGNIIVVTRVGLGKLFRNYFDVCISQDSQGLIVKNGINADFLVYMLKDRVENFKQTSQGSTIQGVTKRQLSEIQIPLPPLETQKEIVAEIEGYQKVIDGARAVVDNYRPQIPIDPRWPMVELREVIQDKPKNGYSGKPVPYATILKVLSLGATTSGTLDISQHKYLDEDIPLDSPCRCRLGDIYLQRGNTKELVGTAAIFNIDKSNFVYPDLMIRVRADKTKILSQFLLRVLQSDSVRDYVTRNAVGAAGSMPKINQRIVERIRIPLPPIARQQTIVAEIESEQALVTSNRELIKRFEKKIQAAIGRVWGGGMTAPALT